MRKTTILFLSLLICGLATAQEKYFTRTGHVSFSSETSMEKIEGHNYQTSSFLSPATGEVVFAVLIKSFEFEKALMQEHFNENYMESDKFPKAKFNGKILNVDKIDFKKDGKYDIEVEGDMEMHGVTKKIKTKGTLEIKGKNIITKSTFPIVLKDYNIAIPSVVKGKIAESVQVLVDLNYEPYNK